MNKQIINLLFIIGICFVAYLLFRNLDYKEGMTTDSSNSSENSSTSSSTSTSTSNGIAGSAQNYAANIKSATIKNQDVLLISKYRTDYENAILNLDDLINTMMLQTSLTVDNANPMTSLEKLVQLNSARGALNNVMKFLDATSQ